MREGSGRLTTDSKALCDTAYSFLSRFSGSQPEQTNPEELIAAAHAGCFSMSLSNVLTQSGHIPQKIHTKAQIVLEKKEGGLEITQSHLSLHVSVKEITREDLEAYAREAEEKCPVSKVLGAKITLEIHFEGD